MNETLKPIDLTTPLCGLGEDYEPESVWAGRTYLPHLIPVTGRGRCTCYPSMRDGEACGDTGIRRLKLSVALRYAREQGAPELVMIDANLNVLKTWPV